MGLFAVTLLVFVGSIPRCYAQAPVADSPTFKIGDEWRGTGGTVLRVAAIEDGMVVTTSAPNSRCPDCRYYRDANFTVVKVVDKSGQAALSNETGLQHLQFPIEVGKTWTSSVTMWSPSANRHNPYDNVYRVESYGDVKTKAGVFKAYAISQVQTYKGAGPTSGPWRATSWYSPEVRRVVKREVHTSGFGSDWELESFTLKD